MLCFDQVMLAPSTLGDSLGLFINCFEVHEVLTVPKLVISPGHEVLTVPKLVISPGQKFKAIITLNS